MTGGGQATESHTESGSFDYRRAAEALYQELVKIRKGEGLTIDSVAEHGTTLMTLAAVDDELERRGWPETDRANAGVHVVECGIEHAVRPYRHKVVLRCTMNLDAIGGPKQNLTARLEEARRRLMLSNSKSEIQGLYQQAFREFAALLARLEQSPCRNQTKSKSDRLRAMALQSSADEWAKSAVQALNELSALNDLGFVPDRPLREALKERITEAFPRGVARAREQRIPTGLVGERLIQSVLDNYYQVVVDNRTGQVSRGKDLRITHTSGMLAIHGTPLRENVFALPAQTLGQFLLGKDAGTQASILRAARFVNTRSSGTVGFYTARDSSLRLLWRLMRQAEQNDWVILAPPRYDRTDTSTHVDR